LGSPRPPMATGTCTLSNGSSAPLQMCLFRLLHGQCSLGPVEFTLF
jgi:hypothetical protein